MTEMIIKRQMGLKNLSNKKGFTLVEVIVVLVILAILMAIAIPALTGYIDKANERNVLAEGYHIRNALQTTATMAYGDGATIAASYTGTSTVPGSTETFTAAVDKLIGQAMGGSITSITLEPNGALTAFTWVKDTANTVTYTDTGGLKLN